MGLSHNPKVSVLSGAKMEVFLEVQQIEDICTDFIDPRKDRQGQPMF